MMLDSMNIDKQLMCNNLLLVMWLHQWQHIYLKL
jgi:hypothetical protein